jgi:agmatine/peptidylarginine deiminase
MAYPERPRDDIVPQVLGERMKVPVTAGPWSLDGGALASNGAGVCVSTLEYVEEHKIPSAGHAARSRLLPAIGCRVLALVPALPEEPTHHVDLFVQFLADDLVAVASVDPELDPGAALGLDRAAATIARAASTLGKDMRIVRPPLGVDIDGSYLPYLNGLRLGDTFLMPTYHAKATLSERAARAVLEDAVPGLKITRIPAAEVAALGGAIHCIALGVFR